MRNNSEKSKFNKYCDFFCEKEVAYWCKLTEEEYSFFDNEIIKTYDDDFCFKVSEFEEKFKSFITEFDFDEADNDFFEKINYNDYVKSVSEYLSSKGLDYEACNKISHAVEDFVSSFINRLITYCAVYYGSISKAKSSIMLDENLLKKEDIEDVKKEYNVLKSDVNKATETLTISTSTLETTNNESNKLKKKLTIASSELKKAKNDLDSLLPNLLTVLSILISIVVAVLIVYITLFLEGNIDTKSIFRNVTQLFFLKYILAVHVVGDLVFLMLFMIARLTNRTILTTCSYFYWAPYVKDKDKDNYTSIYHGFACADCCYKCSFAYKLRRKAAYIIYFNVLMALLYISLYVWWVFDKYINEGRTLKSGDLIFILCVVLVFLLSLMYRYFKKYSFEFARKKLQKQVISKINHESKESNYKSLRYYVEKKKSYIIYFSNSFFYKPENDPVTVKYINKINETKKVDFVEYELITCGDGKRALAMSIVAKKNVSYRKP